MKKPLKVFFAAIVVLVLIIIAAFAYLNFVYLPQKVKSMGPAYLEEKSKGRVEAESVQYIPFKGVKLNKVAILSKAKETLFAIDRLYLKVQIWPLVTRKQIHFRVDLYPPKITRPFVFNGFYQVKERKLDMDLNIKTNLFAREQVITGKIKLSIDKEEKPNISLALDSADLNLQGNLYIEDQDLRIEEFSAKVLNSSFDLIGDVQNISKPLLNIYGNLDIDLNDLKDLNHKYIKGLGKLNMEGRCPGKFYLASKVGNPEAGLKIGASQIMIEGTKVENLSITSQMENKKVSLTKLYAKLWDGEVNLQGAARLDAEGIPANLNINIFNLNLNKIVSYMVDKDIPVHGRVFSLGRLDAPLKNLKAVVGKLWLSGSGSNMLELPTFKGLADVLRLPNLRKVEFKEAAGNFIIGGQAIRTDDFKIVGNNIVIHFKGYMDFIGDLGFDIQPSFSESFLMASPSISNILGVLIDSRGNFLGEIKMKGNIKNPHYAFKPISMEKLLPSAIEKGLKELFKFKKKEE